VEPRRERNYVNLQWRNIRAKFRENRPTVSDFGNKETYSSPFLLKEGTLAERNGFYYQL